MSQTPMLPRTPEEIPMRRRRPEIRPEIPRLEERQLQRLLEVQIRLRLELLLQLRQEEPMPELEEPLLQLLLSLLL